MAGKGLGTQCTILPPKTAHSGVVGTFYSTPGFLGTFNNVADPISNHKLNIITVVNQSQNSFMCETHFFQ